MARAYSIWLVVRHDWDDVTPIIAFTVKHEMVTWIRGQKQGSLDDCSFIRMPDGTEDAGKWFSAQELADAL